LGFCPRKTVKNKTALGILAKSYMDKGDLVPDQVTIDMLEEEVDNDSQSFGFIFDGFPRTESQAQSLDIFLNKKKMKINITLALEANDDGIS
jgi:adenylate kinase